MLIEKIVRILTSHLLFHIQRLKKTAKKIGITAAIAGIALAPFTGGVSLGVTTMGLTAGTLTISTAELIAILAFSLGMTAILKGYKSIKINPVGSVILKK